MRRIEFDPLLAAGSEMSSWASIRFRLLLLAQMAMGIAQRLSITKSTRTHRFACIAAFCAVIMAPIPALAIDDGLTDLVTVPVGSYIIDPSPTTVNGGTRPYGAIYDLVKNQTIPVLWAINPTKVKDAIDFTISGKNYSSSAFIISAEYASAAVVARIVFWRTQGVVIDGPITTAASSIPVYDKITSLPKAVLDSANLALSAHFFIDASIPATAYRTALPAALTACDDFYAMPHADPTYATHQLLKPFNARGGYIWAACHSVSVLEGVNATPPTPAQQLNFLSLNGLVNYTTPGHSDGDGSYVYATGSGGDPVMQFLGDMGPATENGSEQIYLPANPGSWRPTTKVLMWDSPHPNVPGLSPGLAAKLVYGRGFGVASNGRVMYEGGHNHDGAAVANVAAKRAFLNFWLLAGIDARPELAVTGLAATLAAGAPVSLAATVTGGSPAFTYAWTSSCGGTFSSPSAANTTFTPPSVTTATSCIVTVKVTDSCGRVNFQAQPVIVASAAADMAATGNTLPTTVTGGQTVTGTITCANNGPDPATTASCTIPGLPAGATVSCTPTSPTVSPLASGSSMTCNVSYVAPASGTVSATVTAGSSTPDPIPLNNTTPYAATVAAQADMAATGTTLPTSVTAGQTVTGTITCTNNGPSAAAAATCTAPGLPVGATVVCAPASPTVVALASGASMSCNVSYVAPTSGTVTATITAGTSTADSNTANNTLPYTASVVAADMAATGNTLPTSVVAGQVVTGLISCLNNGPSPASAATCSIPGLPAGATVSCVPSSPTLSSLPSGASMNCNVTYTAPASGTVTATVTAGTTTTDPVPGNNTLPYSATVASQADMATTGNTLPTTVTAGQTVTGTITCKNNGASAADSATCTIPGLPAGATVVCTPTSPTASPLASGASMTCNVSYVAPGSGPVTATVTAGSTTADPNTANNTSPYVATVTAVADMATTGNTLPTTVNAGQTVTGTVTCQNNGPSPAVSATCTMPGLPVGATISCAPSSPTAAPLTSGSSMSCNVSYVAPLSGSVSATVTAGSATVDTNPANNTTPYTATVLAQADMAVTGSTLPTVVIAGAAVSGTITCTNNGPSAAAAASCAINGLPAGATTVCAPTSPTAAPLASGASMVCTVNYTAPGTGVVTATITAGSTTADTNPSNNTSPYVASPTPKADMQATVTGLPASAPAGTTISGTVTCTNAGPSPAADAQCGLATLPSGATISCLPSPTPNPLAVGAAITCNVSLVVPASGEVVITANALTTTSDPDPSNNLAQQKTTVSPIADMQAFTTVPSGPMLAGQSVTVSGQCLNAGPSAAVGPICALTGLPVGATVSCTLDPTGAIPDPLPSGSAILCSSTFAAPGSGPLSIATTASAATADSNLTNNVDTKPLAITPQADMSAITTVPASAIAGQPVTVSGRCLNSGPSPAAAPTCALSGLPVGATQTCTLDPSGAIPDPLLAGAAIICTSTFASPSSGPLSITTTAGSTTVDNVPGNEIDTKSLSVDPRADMVVAGNTLPTNVDAGQVVTGSITCANNGPSAATAASCVIAGIPAGATVICTPASPTVAPLPSGGSISCTVSYVAPATGPVSATVTATSATTDPIPGNNTAPYSATVSPRADMAATGNTLPTSVGAGQTVSGIITCTNNGPSPADNANCTIPGLPFGASVSCTPATPTISPLASGASINCNVSYVAPASGTVNATVTASTTTSDPVLANNTLPYSAIVAVAADMVATTTVPSGVVAGAPVTVSGLCTNAGPSAATAPVCALSGLPVGATQTCTLDPVGAIPDPLPVGAAIRCISNFNAPGSGPVSVTTTAGTTTLDPAPGNDAMTRSFIVTPQADMAATGNTLPTTVSAGQTVSGTITCTNNGPSAADAGSCTIPGLPAGATVSCTPTSPTASPLASGASVTCNVSYIAAASGTVNATVTAGATTADPVPGNNTAPYAASVSGQADMAATGNTLPTTVSAGQTVTGTISCTNNGPSAADAASCTIPGLPAAATVSCTPTSPTASPLASGASITCNVSYIAPASGTVNATVTAGSTTADSVPTNNTTPYVATVIAQADMAATGNTLPTTVSAGQTVTGTITCTNNGPSAADAASCTIPGLPAGATVSCTPTIPTASPLASGASISCSVSYVAPASGTVNATVTAGSTTADPVPGNNTALYVATVTAQADLVATVTGLPSNPLAGSIVTAIVTCTNNGPSPATEAHCGVTALPAGAVVVCLPSPLPNPLAVGDSITCAVTLTAPATGEVVVTATATSTTDDPAPTNNLAQQHSPVSPLADMQATTTIPALVVAGNPVLVTGRCVNAGPSPAVLPGCSLSNLPPGTTQTCTLDPSGAIPDPLPSGAAIVCTATFPAPAEGIVSVTTTATAATADPDLANNVQTRPVSVSPLADMQAVTTVPATANAGQSVTISGTCSNNGPSAASAATCALSGLPLGAVQSCLPSPVPALLPIGATITCTATVVVPATGPLSVTTTAGTATPDALPLNDVDTKSMLVTVQADMAATGNTLPTTVSAGQTVTGTITCTNNGPSAADAASCTIPGLPAGATVSCTPTSPTVSPLASGASINCNVSYVAPASGTVNATVTAGSSTADPVPVNNTTPYVASVIGSADMRATVAGLPSAPLAGSAVSGTVTCANAGPSPAASPSCAVTGLPPGATVVCSPNPVPDPLPVGSAIVCQVNFIAPASGGVTVIGTASSTTPDPLPVNNVALQSAGSVPLADMRAATIIPATVAAGFSVTVSGSCANLGPSPAVAATCVLSGLPPGAVQTCSPNPAPDPLVVGASIVCSSTFVAPSTGVLTINTTASGTTADPVLANNVDSRSVALQLPPGPLAVNDSAATAVNTPVTVAVSIVSNDTGSAIRLNDVFGTGGSRCPAPMPSAAAPVTQMLKAGASCTVRSVPGVTCTVPTAHGSVTVCQDGTYTYTPATGYIGPDSFRYEIIDSSGQLASASVDLTISGLPDLITTVTLPSTPPISGSPVTASVVVGNVGAVAAAAVTVTLQLPPGVSSVVPSNGGVYNATTGIVTWPVIATIPGGSPSFATYTVMFVPTPNSLVVVNSTASTLTGESSLANNPSRATLLAAAAPVPSLELWMLMLLSLLLIGAAIKSPRTNINR